MTYIKWEFLVNCVFEEICKDNDAAVIRLKKRDVMVGSIICLFLCQVVSIKVWAVLSPS